MRASLRILAALAALPLAALPDVRLQRLRTAVWEELQVRTPAGKKLQHARAVEQVMRSLAALLGQDPGEWGLAGLAHDIDIAETASDMAQHGVAGASLLAAMGAPATVVHAVKSHDDRANSPRTSTLDKALYCADQGYWFAVESRRGKPSSQRCARLQSECASLGFGLQTLLDICDRVTRKPVKLPPSLMPAAAGPYRVQGTRILDSRGRAYLLRGTQFPAITTNDKDFRGDDSQFGPFSPSSFVTVRHRANMNAARFPINAHAYAGSAAYRERVAEIVSAANRFELLAILAGDGPDLFWSQLANDFRDSPNVLFAGPATAVAPLRAAGVTRPLIVAASEFIDDAQLIYEVTPRYSSLRSGERPWRKLAGKVPVLVNDLDPRLDEASSECAAFPSDPGASAAFLEELLTEFDDLALSWTLSSLRPGRLISDYRFYNWSKLDDGWTCGGSPASAGIGMAILSHLWRTDPHEIFAVAQQRGGFAIARGAVGAVYGRILAEREMTAGPPALPKRLGNISIRIRDARGVARLAPLYSTGAGWSYTTFVVPAETAVGPAEVAVVRSDGTESSAGVVITDVSPALWTATHDGRGPVIAHAVGGGPAWQCSAADCRTMPLNIQASTRVRLEGTGFRYAANQSAIRAFIDGTPAPVISFGATPTPGRDFLLVEFPQELRGRGEVDLYLNVGGEISNVVRIHCGAPD